MGGDGKIDQVRKREAQHSKSTVCACGCPPASPICPSSPPKTHMSTHLHFSIDGLPRRQPFLLLLWRRRRRRFRGLPYCVLCARVRKDGQQVGECRVGGRLPPAAGHAVLELAAEKLRIRTAAGGRWLLR